MRIARLALLLAVLGAGSIAGASSAAVRRPTGLHGFLLTAGERYTTTFHRTPSFAWKPVRGASRYELQLSTSSTFRDNGVLYDDRKLLTPVAAPRLTLPWTTGSPHALYARVRALFGHGAASAWSKAYGFDIVPPRAPTPLSSRPGLLRWTTVEGADRYQVWLLDAGKLETTDTNVLDERELYAFHNTADWIGAVRWRVRAVRLDVIGRVNGMPVAYYGPWSPVYRSTNPSFARGPIRLVSALSDVASAGARTDAPHELMPAFTWTGNETLGGVQGQFFRVYVFTDQQCVNQVFTSAVVGSEAYAPRLSGPLAMPTTPKELALAPSEYLPDGTESTDFMADSEPVAPTEQLAAATPMTALPGAVPGGAGTVTISGDIGAPVDLWDVNWPSTGYYWTVVPVTAVVTETAVDWVDLETPQDACAAGRIQRFGISSQPSLTTRQAPFASGLSAKGRLVSAAHTRKFYGEPLVAWTPAYGATVYEVQWSRKRYPFLPQTDPRSGAKGYLTFSTSALLPLKPGRWWYRVRGFDYNLPSGAQQMAWSKPTEIVATAPKFRVTRIRHHRRRFRVVHKP